MPTYPEKEWSLGALLQLEFWNTGMMGLNDSEKMRKVFIPFFIPNIPALHHSLFIVEINFHYKFTYLS